MLTYFVQTSENRKTGPIPQSYSPSISCPTTCALKGAGCYGETGMTRIFWNRLDRGLIGLSWDEFLSKIRKIEPGRLWRHNVVGDLGDGGGARLDQPRLRQLVAANRGRKGFTYTHLGLDGEGEREAVQEANARGFTVNLSADTLQKADSLRETVSAPVVVIVPSDPASWPSQTPEGRRILVCPATTHGKTCLECRLCYKADRNFLVGFPSHGTRKALVDRIAAG